VADDAVFLCLRLICEALRSSSALICATRASAFWLRSQAFSSASHSIPLCSEKPASSDAITARLRFTEMRS
jgi:hypothetical protein